MATTTSEIRVQRPPDRESPSKRNGAPLMIAPPFGGIRLANLWGVEIVADWSLLLIFSFVVYNLGVAVFPSWHPDWSPALVWITAIAAAVLFWLSILLHEMTHAWVGRAQSMNIRRITLFLFGGAAHLEGEPKSPRAEFLMAGAGPLCSALIGVAAIAAGSLLAGPQLQQAIESGSPEAAALAMTQVGPLPTLLLWLGPINLMLALFNIIPGFPLDGGRVLRSLLWWATGDLPKATRWATGVGRGIAWALIVWGVWIAFGGALLPGLWFVLIGWFLHAAALGAYHRTLSQTHFQEVPVDAVMRTQLMRVAPDLSVEAFVHDYVMKSDQQGFPVEAEGELLGLVTFEDVRYIERAAWPNAFIADIMTQVTELPTVDPSSPALDVLQDLSRSRSGQIPVVRDRQLVGMLQHADLLKWLSLNIPGGARVSA